MKTLPLLPDTNIQNNLFMGIDYRSANCHKVIAHFLNVRGFLGTSKLFRLGHSEQTVFCPLSHLHSSVYGLRLASSFSSPLSHCGGVNDRLCGVQHSSRLNHNSRGRVPWLSVCIKKGKSLSLLC